MDQFHQHVYLKLLHFQILKAQKDSQIINVFFALSRSLNVKALCKMLMKSTPRLNFTNILQATFGLITFCQKIHTQTVPTEKLYKILLHKNPAHKMLLILTPKR